MLMSAPSDDVADANYRHHNRVKVSLAGKFFIAQREFPCRSVDVSLGGITVAAPANVPIGEHVVLWFDDLGWLEGHVCRHGEGTFSVALALASDKRDCLEAKLTWLAYRGMLDRAGDRNDGRTVQVARRSTMYLPEECDEYPVRILEASPAGAAIATDARPRIGSSVAIGKTIARVVRHTEAGIAVDFVTRLPVQLVDGSLES